MTMPPAIPAPEAAEIRTLHLEELLRRPITDRSGETLGRLSDVVVVRLRGADLPLVIGGIAAVGGREVFVPIEQATAFDGTVLKLASVRIDLRHFERREGEVLLRADVLGHRLIDVEAARLVKAADLELTYHDGEWVLAGVDIRRRAGWLRRLTRTSAGQGAAHPFREWVPVRAADRPCR